MMRCRGCHASRRSPVSKWHRVADPPAKRLGADLRPQCAITPETVKFLLVHHTASKQQRPGSSGGHPPDLCLPHRPSQALAGPVFADATGGNQGHAQLVCLIGDFQNQPPTPAAQDSLMRMLINLADRYGVPRQHRLRTACGVAQPSARHAPAALRSRPDETSRSSRRPPDLNDDVRGPRP